MTTPRRPRRIDYPRPSFLGEMGRALDLGGTLNQYDADDLMEIYQEMRARRLARPTGPAAEMEAMREVWRSVGQNIRDAMGDFANSELGKPQSGERSE